MLNIEAKLEALEVFDEIADAVERPNGITIEDGMAVTGLAYHCFYCVALQLKEMGKIKLIRNGENEVRLIAPNAPCSKEAQLFTSPTNTAGELRRFLADVTAGIRDGSVDAGLAEAIASTVGAQINQAVLAEAK